MNRDTIYAVSTAAGMAAVAVIRISGPGIDAILMRLCRRSDFVTRRATLTPIFDESGEVLDKGLVIKFDAPRSFTGESMAEFQVTGGRAVVRGVLRAISACPCSRPAEAGEFAKRAFENNKIDLVEVEGLAEVVAAETRMQLRHAQVLASGDLSRVCEEARSELLHAMAFVESLLDFSDVEDTSDLTIDEILPALSATKRKLESLLENASVSERLRDGMSVVIAGPPNVGKSTLLNCLANRDVAIVSPVAGTTRDTIEVYLEIEGFPVILTDTAGLRTTVDPVENEGIVRTRRKAAQADLILWLSDNENAGPDDEAFSAPVLKVRTKVDQSQSSKPETFDALVSAKTGHGLEPLLTRISAFARKHFAGAGTILAASERQRSAIRDVIRALEATADGPKKAPEMIAEELRSAVTSLGRVTGRIDVEEVLGEIFSRLCVGK